MGHRDPPRGELWFRLAFSLVGLFLMAVALGGHGIPEGPAIVEVVGLAGLFFGGSALWSARRLWRRR
jgi:hypothetical protein